MESGFQNQQHQSHLDFTKDEFLKPALEALLFIYGQPIGYKRLEQILKVDRERIASVIEQLREEMGNRGGGLRIMSDGTSAQMVTAPKYAPVVQSVVKEEFSESLTPAALEALSIVAYRGPLSRAEIDYIRGVNSSYILRNLLMRGLIERYQDPQRPKSYLYRASFDLLRALGLEKIDELPEYQKYHDLDFSSDEEGEEENPDTEAENTMNVRNVTDIEENETLIKDEGNESSDAESSTEEDTYQKNGESANHAESENKNSENFNQNDDILNRE